MGDVKQKNGAETEGLDGKNSLAYTLVMNRRFLAVFVLACLAPLAGCGTASSDGRLHSHSYQEEAQSRVPGHNLYRMDSLDTSAAQRVNQFSRSEFIHEQQRTYVQRLTEAQALDKAAQKLGREPGSLFRR